MGLNPLNYQQSSDHACLSDVSVLAWREEVPCGGGRADATSPVIGYHQEAVVVQVKGLPVQSRVSLQGLVTEETPPPLIPSIDDRQLRLRLL